MQAYDKVRESISKKLEDFKKKFETSKTEMSQEMMKAETPEDMIALGKKLQEQGEALKVEEASANEETKNEDFAGEMAKEDDLEIEHQKAERQGEENLGAEMAKDTENEIAAKELEELKLKDETESAEKAEAILSKLNGEEGGWQKKQAEQDAEMKKRNVAWEKLMDGQFYNDPKNVDTSMQMLDEIDEMENKLGNKGEYLHNNQVRELVAFHLINLHRLDDAKKIVSGMKDGGSKEERLKRIEIASWNETEKAVDEMSKMMMDPNDLAKEGEEFVVANNAFHEKRAKLAAEVARKAGFESFRQVQDAEKQIDKEVVEAEKNGSKNLPELQKKQTTLTRLGAYVAHELYVNSRGEEVSKF